MFWRLNPNQTQTIWWLVGFSCLLILIQIPGEPLAHVLRFERDAILSGEYWRVITGHLVHLNWTHLLLNIGGLALVYVWCGFRLTAKTWGIAGLISALGISGGFLLLNPLLNWYLGLSGILHGWFMVGALEIWRQRGWRPGAALVGFLVIKLAWEIWRGPLPGTSEIIGSTVIVGAHLYGALTGLIYFLVHITLRRRQKKNV